MKGDIKFLLFLIFSALFLSACKNSSVEPSAEDHYPTIIRSLSESEYEKLQMEFDQINNYEIHVELNRYGYTAKIRANSPPETKVYLTKDEAVDIACKGLVKNRKFTNIKDYNAIISKVEAVDTINGAGTSAWFIQFGLQNYKGYRVLFTKILVSVFAGKVFEIFGSWYPDIYIPLKDVMTPDSARKKIIGTKIPKFGIVLNPFLTVTDSLIGNISEKVIVPVEQENLLEMRVAWEIPIMDDAFHVYLDTRTGEIVKITQERVIE